MPKPSPSAPREMLTRTVELPVPDGVMRGKVAVTTGQMRLSGLVRTAYALTDAMVARANDLEVENGHTISCQASCGACCRHMVPVSPPEAFYLMDYIDSVEPDRRKAVLKRFDNIVETLTRHEMIDELLDPDFTDDPILPAAREYFGLRLACPLLVDESCSIHPHRPVACRDYNVTSPPEWCRQPYEHEVAKVPMPLPLSAPLARLTAAVTGEKPSLIPLSLVPHWVDKHPDLRKRQWPGPDLFDMFLDEIGATRGSDE